MFVIGAFIGTLIFWSVVIGLAEARPLDEIIDEAKGE